MTTALGPNISDHRAVISTLNFKKVQPKRQVRRVRELHAVTTDKRENEFNPENIKPSPNLDVNVESLATEFRRVLNKLATSERMLSIT